MFSSLLPLVAGILVALVICSEGYPQPGNDSYHGADVCQLPAEVGFGKAYVPSFFFNSKTGNCERFIYGGAGGNQNRFAREEDCKAKCNTETNICPPGDFVEIENQCFSFHDSVNSEQYKAIFMCRENEAFLATVKHPIALKDYVVKNYPGSNFWVGGKKTKEDGWVWTDGSAINGSFPKAMDEGGNFMPVEGGGDCMVLRYLEQREKQEFFNDKCNENYGYICEGEKVKAENAKGRIWSPADASQHPPPPPPSRPRMKESSSNDEDTSSRQWPRPCCFGR